MSLSPIPDLERLPLSPDPGVMPLADRESGAGTNGVVQDEKGGRERPADGKVEAKTGLEATTCSSSAVCATVIDGTLATNIASRKASVFPVDAQADGIRNEWVSRVSPASFPPSAGCGRRSG